MKAKTLVGKPTIGFGVPNVMDPHHFIVTIPKDHTRKVAITEDYGIQATIGDGIVERCELSWHTWIAVAEEVQIEFNKRLREKRLPTSRWKTGENKVERLLGKELLVLAWAVEHADSSVIPKAIRNWMGLKPEERWWLCTMTAAATGKTDEGGRGWRQALQHILTENPVKGEDPRPRPLIEIVSRSDERGLYRPIQTVKAVSEATGISRFTIVQAIGRGDFGEDAYQSGSTWLIDTTGPHFQRWLRAYSTQPRVKGRLDRKPRSPEN
jgi:hypothetical protein